MPTRNDVISVDFTDDRCVTVVREGERPWTLRVDATGGHHALVPRGALRTVGDLLLLFTEGEHRRTGAAARHVSGAAAADARAGVRARDAGRRGPVAAAGRRGRGDGLGVTVSGWFTGTLAPPRGAGEFAVWIAL